MPGNMENMAKSSSRAAKPQRGRPVAEIPLNERILVRFDKATRAALDEFVRLQGHGAAATAIRMVVIDRLRKEGLLGREKKKAGEI